MSIIFILLFFTAGYSKLISTIFFLQNGVKVPEIDYINDNRFYEEPAGKISTAGIISNYLIGSDLRTRLISKEKLLSETYSENKTELIILCQNDDASIKSASAFLNGIYPQVQGKKIERNPYINTLDLLVPLANKTISAFDLNSILINNDWALPKIQKTDDRLHSEAFNKSYCPLVGDLYDSYINTKDFGSLEKYFADHFYDTLHKELLYQDINLERKNLSMKALEKIWKAYLTAEFHGIKLLELEKNHLNAIKVIAQQYKYEIKLRDPLISQILASRYFEFILKNIKDLRKSNSYPKGIFIFGEYEHTASLLQRLLLRTHIIESESMSLYPIGSAISIEIHQTNEAKPYDYLVKAFFNDRPLKFKLCKCTELPFDSFLNFIEYNIIDDLNEFCKGDI